MLEPTSIEELQTAVRDHSRVLAVGGGTKTRLAVVGNDCQLISTCKLSGVTEYEPSEYTFTALAGTPIQEIHETLQAKGQFLPCSALLRKSGATLGGAIGSGLSGPGQFRFGGIRDFLLGIRFVTGEGKIVSAGGKVVKNAAGFDLPKFMVGSLGRYGIIAEVTFKVFPAPHATTTLRVQCDSHEQAVSRIIRSSRSRWEPYAADYDAQERTLYLRLGGRADPIKTIAVEIVSEWPEQTSLLSDEESENHWAGVRELRWAQDGAVASKVPLTPNAIPTLQKEIDLLDGLNARYGAGGNVAVIAANDSAMLVELSHLLKANDLIGMTFIGSASDPLWLGDRQTSAIEAKLKSALDPHQRFPPITD